MVLTVEPPMPNATISVMEVTVTDTPACLRARAIRSSRGSFCSSSVRLLHAPTITNISSTPIPVEKNLFYQWLVILQPDSSTDKFCLHSLNILHYDNNIRASSWENVSSGVSNQVRLKLACSATEASRRLEILVTETRDITLSRQWTTKALVRLRGCSADLGLCCSHMT